MGLHEAASEGSDETKALQHEVQRKLGRCLLRIQQYEHLMKSLLASRQLAGPAAAFEALRSARADTLATKSLGHLVGELTGSFVTTGQAVVDLEPSSEGNDAWFAIRL